MKSAAPPAARTAQRAAQQLLRLAQTVRLIMTNDPRHRKRRHSIVNSPALLSLRVHNYFITRLNYRAPFARTSPALAWPLFAFNPACTRPALLRVAQTMPLSLPFRCTWMASPPPLVRTHGAIRLVTHPSNIFSLKIHSTPLSLHLTSLSTHPFSLVFSASIPSTQYAHTLSYPPSSSLLRAFAPPPITSLSHHPRIHRIQPASQTHSATDTLGHRLPFEEYGSVSRDQCTRVVVPRAGSLEYQFFGCILRYPRPHTRPPAR